MVVTSAGLNVEMTVVQVVCCEIVQPFMNIITIQV